MKAASIRPYGEDRNNYRAQHRTGFHGEGGASHCLRGKIKQLMAL